MYEHMINWKLVTMDMAGITPKGNDSAYIHIETPTDTILVVKGNRELEPLFVPYNPGHFVPVYGF